MTITIVDATHVAVNGISHLKSGLTVIMRGQEALQIITNADGTDLVPNTNWKNLTDGATGEKFVSQAAFITAMGLTFGLSPDGTKKALFVANTAAAQSGAYVQADVVSIVTELRAVKTALINAGVMAAS